MLEAAQAHVIADDVKHSHHLAEYQHPAGPDQAEVSHAHCYNSLQLSSPTSVTDDKG